MPHPEHVRLAELVDEGDAEGVLALVSLDEIAACWCEYFAQLRDEIDRGDVDTSDEDDPNMWATQFGTWCVSGEMARAFILALLASPDAEPFLDTIGAGPFEDKLDCSDESDLSWIESQAASNDRFRVALRNMRIDWGVSYDNRVRVYRAAGIPPERWNKDNP